MTIEHEPIPVLYVEDNDASATLMQRVLRARPSIALTIASDTASARREIAARPFRLILSDINLPDGSVEDLVEQLRSDPGAPPPIMVLSADPTARTPEEMSSLGVGAFIAKPFQIDELLSVIDDLLGASRGDR